LWNGGEPLTIVADGGTVPAFAVNLTAPAQAQVTVPSLATGSIDRSSGLEVEWLGGSGTFRVILADGNIADLSLQHVLWCNVPASSGRASISPAVLAYLTPGNGFWGFDTTDTRDAGATGNWDVLVVASYPAVWRGTTTTALAPIKIQ
jgi:hypothetical protein